MNVEKYYSEDLENISVWIVGISFYKNKKMVTFIYVNITVWVHIQLVLQANQHVLNNTKKETFSYPLMKDVLIPLYLVFSLTR